MPSVAAQSLASWMDAPQACAPAARASEARETGDALVCAAMAGDPAAFGELIDRHERAALAVAFAATRDAALAADAVQEACLKAWRKRQSLADPQRFAGWLLHIVRRCALDQLRARKTVVSLAVEETGPREVTDAAERLMQIETGRRIRSALEELDDDTRLAVVMRYYDNSPAKDIAEVLGCSPAAVDMRLKRARDKLREKLSDLSDDAQGPHER